MDVLICGGGLAGLTLALQLARECPLARVRVLEKAERPLPEGGHKVGESSVELASHYFGEVLGLKAYLEKEHLNKNGLRFFCGDTEQSLASRVEIGPPEFPLVPSYQLDRGKLENDLRAMCDAQPSIELIEGVQILDIALAEPPYSGHRVTTRAHGSFEGDWVIDATGRRRILQKKLDLQRESPQKASAAWFRIAHVLKVEDLIAQDLFPEWVSRDVDHNRWLSTNHLMGRGYWIWLIPLSTGMTSVGIVANHDAHDFSAFNTEERARAWIAEHEPALGEALSAMPLVDFKVRANYSYLSAQILGERWACVGEAGFFLDPLYSLGSDFLGMGNSYTARLIADDLRGEYSTQVRRSLDELAILLARDASRTLSGNTEIFAHGDAYGAKVWWDFFNYWGFMTTHFFKEIWRQDAPTLKRFLAMGQRWYDLNTHAQEVLRAWAHARDHVRQSVPRSWIQIPAPRTFLAELHRDLPKAMTPDETFAQMEAHHGLGELLVTEFLIHALRDLEAAELEQFFAQLKEALSAHPWQLRIDPSRFEIELLSRRERVDAMPEIARDLERGIGRRPLPSDFSARAAQLLSLIDAHRAVAEDEREVDPSA